MEKILKLLNSQQDEDIIIGISILLNHYERKEIIDFFNEYGTLNRVVRYGSETLAADLCIDIFRITSRWKYYHKDDLGIFWGHGRIELHNHPAIYSEAWQPEEL